MKKFSFIWLFYSPAPQNDRHDGCLLLSVPLSAFLRVGSFYHADVLYREKSFCRKSFGNLRSFLLFFIVVAAVVLLWEICSKLGYNYISYVEVYCIILRSLITCFYVPLKSEFFH